MDRGDNKTNILAILMVIATAACASAQQSDRSSEPGVYKPPMLIDGQVITDYDDTPRSFVEQTNFDVIDGYEEGEIYFDGDAGDTCASSCDGRGCTQSVGCGCNACCQPCFGNCLPFDRMFGGIEYLMWWRRGQTLPPLVQVGDTGGVAPDRLVFGGADEGNEMTSGSRVTLGLWDPGCCNSLIVRFYTPGVQETAFTASDASNTVAGIPFFDTNLNANNFFLVADTGIQGSVNVSTRSEIYGGDVLLRRKWGRGLGGKAEFFWGYQTTRINEDITIGVDTTITATNNRVQVTDVFDTKNEFHGATFGFDGSYQEGRWSGRLMTKLGFGSLNRRVSISGNTIRSNGANNVAVDNQGFLARSTNIGDFSSSKFSFSPEVTFTLGYDIRPGVKFTFGYNFLLLTNVLQPWQLIDTQTSDIDTNPTLRPALQTADDDYWVQGMQWGLFWRY